MKEKKYKSVWPDGYGRRVLTEVDSTLDEARRIAPDLPGPTWIMARVQTAGRGRRGRPWRDPAGNLAATLIFPGGDAPTRAALRSFVASLALFDALETVIGGRDGLALKWPNDVLLYGGKVAGILLESTGQGQRGSYLAIGIGVNLKSAPDHAQVESGAARPVSVLSETGTDVEAEHFFNLLAASFAQQEARFETYGFEPIRQGWLSRAARLGEVITARTNTTVRQGTFRDLDGDGNLVLQTAVGLEVIPAGEVFF